MTGRPPRLAGKVAIVTGAATGIGEATARLYAEEGARVVLADIRAAEGKAAAERIQNTGSEALFVPTDVSAADDLKHLVETTEKTFGRLDILTANAGVLGRNPFAPLHEASHEDFVHTIEINLYGVANAFRFAIPALLRAGGGALSATTSLAAHRGVSGLAAYSSSKAGIAGLVRSLATTYATAIRVNAVSPGAVRTELPGHTAELNRGSVDWPERSHVPIAEPEQIASVHLFLVSDDASFINGQVLKADGGRSVFDIA